MPRPRRKAAFANSLLASLPSSDAALVGEACEPTELIFGSNLYTPGDRIQHVYFPTNSYISLITPAGASESLEVGLYDESEIPWEDIAFLSVEFALRRYFEDRRKGREGVHFRDIDWQDGKVALRDR